MRHVVGLSGGKDSTALALRLRELNPSIDYEYICTPTGNELPELFDHLDRLETILGKSILRLGCGLNLYQLIEEQKMIPNFRARFCTRILKIEPTIEYMRALPEGSLLYVGLRADEKQRGGIYGDYVTSIYPMQQWGWGIDDVRQYLIRRGIDVPKRTDCGVCFYQRLSEWYSLWKDYPEYYQQGVDVEAASGYTFRSPGRDTWPASLAELREEFKAGRVPRGVHLNRDLFGDEQPICRACSL